MSSMEQHLQQYHCFGKRWYPLTFGLFFNVISGLTGFQLGMMYTVNDKNVHCQCPLSQEPLLVSQQNMTINERKAAFSESALSSLQTSLPVTPNQSVPPHKWPISMRQLLAGFARVSRKEFIQKFDVGVPWDETEPGNREVLLIYTSPKSRPTHFNSDTVFPWHSAASATENCHVMRVILTNTKAPRECLAVVGQWQSNHVHKFMRLPPDSVGDNDEDVLSNAHPLRLVSRTHDQDNKRISFITKHNLLNYYKDLSAYLSNFHDTLQRLRPIAARVAGNNNVIVAMVTNFGQSELLMNFVCSARARGLDLSHLLVFASDQATVDIVQSLDISVFNVEGAFGKLPTEASPYFGAPEFVDMAMSKIYTVHLLTKLGHDVLLHDVDIVWYRDPIVLFQNFTLEVNGFDLVFQDDGSHTDPYSPFAANTGCFYVKHNERTSFFFSSLIRFGDLVRSSRNDQQAINMLLGDHASLSGLRVKVLGRDTADGQALPGGFHYHRRPDFMRELMLGKKTSYLFHMSWTNNKKNKIEFFQQMKDWFVQDQCIGKSIDEMVRGKNQTTIHSLCCVTTPVMKCHYRDMPSKTPCRRSPAFKSNPSFW